MRLILLSIIIGFITFSDYSLNPLFSYTDRERLYGLIALCSYLLCEAIIHIRFNRHFRRLSLSQIETTQRRSEENTEIKSLEAEILTLKDQLKTAKKETANNAATASVKATPSPEALNHQAVVLLGLLQQKGRLVDFVMEDITSIDDARVGAVARIVHEGCGKVLKDHFSIQPIFSGTEGQTIKLQPPFDPSHYRLSGKVSEKPPYSGRIVHKGWKSSLVRLPQPIENSDNRKDMVIAPAEVDCNG